MLSAKYEIAKKSTVFLVIYIDLQENMYSLRFDDVNHQGILMFPLRFLSTSKEIFLGSYLAPPRKLHISLSVLLNSQVNKMAIFFSVRYS